LQKIPANPPDLNTQVFAAGFAKRRKQIDGERRFSQDERLWNDRFWRKPAVREFGISLSANHPNREFRKIEVSVGPPRGSDKED